MVEAAGVRCCVVWLECVRGPPDGVKSSTKTSLRTIG